MAAECSLPHRLGEEEVGRAEVARVCGADVDDLVTRGRALPVAVAPARLRVLGGDEDVGVPGEDRDGEGDVGAREEVVLVVLERACVYKADDSDAVLQWEGGLGSVERFMRGCVSTRLQHDRRRVSRCRDAEGAALLAVHLPGNR